MLLSSWMSEQHQAFTVPYNNCYINQMDMNE
jgi:hypothetical protein